MAYYGYTGDVDECYSSSYGHVFGAASPPYDPGEPNLINDHSFGTAYQYSSAYDLSEPNLIDYSSPSYYADDYSASAYSNPINYTRYDYSGYSGVNQSETIYSQPKYLQYDPPPHYQGIFPSQTKFTVSYSKVEFDEPEFPEYDPTPYGGGYDQTLTYGKPHPPSDLTCYPRSLPQSDAPLENFSFASIPSPYGRDDEPPIKPPNRSKPADTKAETGRDNSYVESGGQVNDDGKPKDVISNGGGNIGKDVEVVEPKDVISNGDGNIGKDVEPKDVVLSGGYPSIEHQYGFNVPYGAGLEAMDICESLFGYWPCVAKKAEQQRNPCQVCKPDSRMDPWKPAADYLFGSPLPYDSYYYTHHHHSPYQSDQISWLQ